MDIEIESLLFKQVEKPKNHFLTKVISLWENRYRVNVYIEIEEDGLIKRKIQSSYFCHYNSGKLTIIPEPDYKSPELKKKQRL
jgi:HEPN domain-containing protein